MLKERIKAKELNKLLMKEKFVDKDIDEWLYASLTQPPVQVVDKCGSDDELKWLVFCPNCGEVVNYGTNTYMVSGYIYCGSEGCKESLLEKIGNN